ncbi:PTS sugar transporter subunit IIA, partial [bacterium]|nr:PTS sugar transporter subunit IIA [bacterium]
FLGFVIYWIFGRKKTQKEFALLHLIGRITNRELTSNTLEQELLDIVHHRDGISKDRFDYLVEQSPVLDIESEIDMNTFFEMIAEKLAEPLGIQKEELRKKFCDRESDTSTVLLPFLSVPHILIDGNKIFHLLIVRCKEGISFLGQDEKVVSAFVMVGSRDERTFHLQALAAVAQISQSPDFEERWIGAKSEQDIRNILLLGRWRH